MIRGASLKMSTRSISLVEPINLCRRRGSLSPFPTALKIFRRENISSVFVMRYHVRLENGSSGNIDKDLFEIRKSLASQYGEGFYFYRSPIVEQWEREEFSSNDIELIRQSRSRDRYTDFSPEERSAHKRVHEALRRLGKTTLDELGGGRDYVLKLTSGFHPNSGIRGGKPKDLWFGVFRKENEKRFLGNPQLFMIVSDRGVEWGFSPLTHPDDFTNQDIRRGTREIAKSVLAQLPAQASKCSLVSGCVSISFSRTACASDSMISIVGASFGRSSTTVSAR